MSLLSKLWHSAGKKRKIGDKVHCGASFRDISKTTDKKVKKSVYFLFSTKPNRRRSDFKRTISNNTPKKYIVGIKKLCFIYNEYQESDSNAYNCGDLGKCCEQGARRKLFDTMDVFLQDPAAKFFEAATSLYMKIGYEAQNVLKLIYITIISVILNLYWRKSSKQ